MQRTSVQVLRARGRVTQIQDARIPLSNRRDVIGLPSDSLGRSGSPDIACMGAGDGGVEDDV